MKICLSTETFADLPEKLIKEFNVSIIHSSVIFGTEIKKDGLECNSQDVFDYYDKTGKLATTTAINEAEFDEYFENLLKEYDEVIHISFTSKSSLTCTNAISSSEKFGGKVQVVDSLSLSSGIALEVCKCRDLMKEHPDWDAKKLKECLEDYRQYIQASFIVNTLTYLYKGGRVKGLTAVVANVLRIKPQIILVDGDMKTGHRYMGSKDAKIMEQYAKDIFTQFPNPDLDRVFITYPSASDETVETAVRMCKERGFKHIYKCFAGATISAHCGPKTIGILFASKDPVNWGK
ncbi:MAG: DegV family EDD domain-containing protein [Coprobacillus sp.]|nr:DegV family EDD domain-containing protein [Coprobacillus sp.]